MEKELFFCLFRLATKNLDIFSEVKECMSRMPWDEIRAMGDTAESSWFKNGDGDGDGPSTLSLRTADIEGKIPLGWAVSQVQPTPFLPDDAMGPDSCPSSEGSGPSDPVRSSHRHANHLLLLPPSTYHEKSPEIPHCADERPTAFGNDSDTLTNKIPQFKPLETGPAFVSQLPPPATDSPDRMAVDGEVDLSNNDPPGAKPQSVIPEPCEQHVGGIQENEMDVDEFGEGGFESQGNPMAVDKDDGCEKNSKGGRAKYMTKKTNSKHPKVVVGVQASAGSPPKNLDVDGDESGDEGGGEVAPSLSNGDSRPRSRPNALRPGGLSVAAVSKGKRKREPSFSRSKSERRSKKAPHPHPVGPAVLDGTTVHTAIDVDALFVSLNFSTCIPYCLIAEAG